MNKTILIISLLTILLFLTGCSMLEIEDYSIVAGIGIDYENDEFIITYEIYEENNGQTTNLTSTTKTERGKTISQATNKIATQTNKKPYLNHTSVIILNEQVVKQKFNETINYLLHDVRIRSACIVMITKEQTTKEIFEQSQKQNKVIAYEIYKHFDIKKGIIEKWSNSKFNEIINELIAQEISEIMSQYRQYIFNTKEDKKITGGTSYERTKFLVKNFYETYKKEILESRKDGNIEIIYNAVGKENFEELNQLFHEYNEHFNIGFGMLQVYEDLENNVKTELTQKFKELVARRNNILAKMEEHNKTKSPTR